MDVKNIEPAHIRAAIQMAVGRGIKFPSIELEEFVAKFLNGLRKVEAADEQRETASQLRS
jgi:hypothetical protein